LTGERESCGPAGPAVTYYVYLVVTDEHGPIGRLDPAEGSLPEGASWRLLARTDDADLAARLMQHPPQAHYGEPGAPRDRDRPSD
jgi:hypothetical protein